MGYTRDEKRYLIRETTTAATVVVGCELGAVYHLLLRQVKCVTSTRDLVIVRNEDSRLNDTDSSEGVARTTLALVTNVRNKALLDEVTSATVKRLGHRRLLEILVDDSCIAGVSSAFSHEGGLLATETRAVDKRSSRIIFLRISSDELAELLNGHVGELVDTKGKCVVLLGVVVEDVINIALEGGVAAEHVLGLISLSVDLHELGEERGVLLLCESSLSGGCNDSSRCEEGLHVCIRDDENNVKQRQEKEIELRI